MQKQIIHELLKMKIMRVICSLKNKQALTNYLLYIHHDSWGHQYLKSSPGCLCVSEIQKM